jgi:hypothetical protein
MKRMAEELAQYLRGWRGYFGKCETPSVLEGLEKWTRRRLRSAIWKQWKRGRVRFAELQKRGVGKDLAAKTSGQRSLVRGGLQTHRDFISHCPMPISTRSGFRD